jgi:hypothetical protein
VEPEPRFRPGRFGWSENLPQCCRGPGVPVAVKVTGLPVIPEPATVAVSVLVPGTDPRVHSVSVTFPVESVVCE